MGEEKKLSKDKLDKWLITAMSHMKTMYEDNGIPWSNEDEATFQQVRHQCLEKQAELNQDLIDKQARELNIQLDFVGKRDIDRFTLLRDFIGNLPRMIQKEPSKEELEKLIREWFESIKQKKGEYVSGNTLDGNFPLEELAKFLIDKLKGENND